MMQSKNDTQKGITPITPLSIIENQFGESRKTPSSKPNDSLCKLCREFFESIPYALQCWFRNFTNSKTIKYYSPFEYSKNLEELIKIFNKTNSETKRKGIHDEIQVVALKNIENVANLANALKLKEQIDQINSVNGSTLIHDLTDALKIHCKNLNLQIDTKTSRDKKRTSSIYIKNKGIF